MLMGLQLPVVVGMRNMETGPVGRIGKLNLMGPLYMQWYGMPVEIIVMTDDCFSLKNNT